MEPERSYSEAIAHLNEVIALINRPGEGLGCAWGLLRGQAGAFVMLRARSQLERLRDDMARLERIEEASEHVATR